MGKYLLVYVLLQGAKKEERYISYMEEILSEFCSKSVYVECQDKEEWEDAVFREWMRDSDENEKNRGLICVTSRLFGPFWNIGKDLDEFEAGEEKAMAYYDPETDSPDFFVLKEEVCPYKVLWKQEIAKRRVCNRAGAYTIREDWFRPYTLICRGNPFLNMECMASPDYLKYTLGEEPARAISWICKEADYNADMIWETILKRYNLYDIKQAMHLNWIVQEKEAGLPAYLKETAVFMHLFYEESLDEVISYIKEVPSKIDIYITTCPGRTTVFMKKLEENDISGVKILQAGGRGRDAGALLVAFRPYLMRYKYICFLHDKRSSGGLEPESVGKSFMKLMWDSLLKNEGYIYGILKRFEENTRLGVLSPPLPLMGMYLKTIVGVEWTVCFGETEKLAHRLGCRIKIDPDKPVFALSTSFWCRTQALEPLFTYPWKYEDFPEEPLPLDGTLNHAIERILIYIAQEQGFYSATVTTEEYASRYMENQSYLLDELFGELHKEDWLDIKIPLNLGGMLEELCRLAVFCRTHRRLYIYGAGAQAEILLNRLKNLKVEICGVVVTKKHGKDRFQNYEIKEFCEIQKELNSDCGIILAMSQKYQAEVIGKVEKTGVDYFRIRTED